MKPVKIFSTITLVLISIIVWTSEGQALPVISQVGNLLDNGNFESGTMIPVNRSRYGAYPSAFDSWDQWLQPSNPPPSVPLYLSTQQVTNPLIEGNYTAHISGNEDDGLFQYKYWARGTYTLSGWVYVVSGSAHLGIFWQSGTGIAYTPSSSTTNQWEFLQLTVAVPMTVQGPLVYAASNSSDFYAEGIWFNTGTTNTSPFSPSAGFDPTHSVPEPTTMVLLGLGLMGLAGMMWKFRFQNIPLQNNKVP